jgi:arsenite methyltransferase
MTDQSASAAPDLSDPAVVEAYDELPLWSAMAGQLLFRHLPLGPGLTALDLGCGTGFPAIELAERLGATSTVFGLDPWATALARARRKATTRGLPHLNFVRGDGAAMPFRSGAFDLVVSNLGVNNFGDPPTALAECRRILRPTGRLALTTNLRGHWAEFYDLFRSVLDADLVAGLDRHVGHRATVESLDAALGAAGFRIARVERDEVPMRFATGSAFLRHSFVRLGFAPAWHALFPIGRANAVMARLEAALNDHAAAHGGLVVTVPLAYVEAVPSESQ